MILIYRLGIALYRLVVNVASLFSNKAKLASVGRKNIFEDLESINNDDNHLWVHCASLGEFEQGRPIIEQLHKTFTDHKIILTFFSPSGYEIRKNYPLAHCVTYIPWDTPQLAKKFVEMASPKLAVFIKYEFWHYHICELSKRNIPIISASSIFRPYQIYFKPYGRFYLDILKKINHFFVQDRKSNILLTEHDINQVTIAGDTRFDRVANIQSGKKDLPEIAKFKGNDMVMVVGSCWPEDIDLLMSFINESDMKFIIAPHEIDGKCQKIIQNESLKSTILYSQIEHQKGDEQILVIDNIGLLSSLYGYGEYAYIGGAFGAGLHNILEAATYGVPIFFGDKNYKKFNEAVDLINLGGAIAVRNESDLLNQFKLISNEKSRNIIFQINTDYVNDNTGATQKIINYCTKILSA